MIRRRDNESFTNKRCKIDKIDNKIMRLQNSNINRYRKIKDLERYIVDLEKTINDLKSRINFLECISQQSENENIYFRNMYYK